MHGIRCWCNLSWRDNQSLRWCNHWSRPDIVDARGRQDYLLDWLILGVFSIFGLSTREFQLFLILKYGNYLFFMSWMRRLFNWVKQLLIRARLRLSIRGLLLLLFEVLVEVILAVVELSTSMMARVPCGRRCASLGMRQQPLVNVGQCLQSCAPGEWGWGDKQFTPEHVNLRNRLLESTSFFFFPF